jgi:hypothetical protein
VAETKVSDFWKSQPQAEAVTQERRVKKEQLEREAKDFPDYGEGLKNFSVHLG